MPRFPRSEPEIAVLGLLVTQGLGAPRPAASRNAVSGSTSNQLEDPTNLWNPG